MERETAQNERFLSTVLQEHITECVMHSVLKDGRGGGHLYETWPIKHCRQRNRMDERVMLVLR